MESKLGLINEMEAKFSHSMTFSIAELMEAVDEDTLAHQYLEVLFHSLRLTRKCDNKSLTTLATSAGHHSNYRA